MELTAHRLPAPKYEPMNDNRENGIAIIAFFLWAAILAVLFGLCSCTSKKVVTEYVTVHDTLTVHKSDTIKDVVYKTHTDTVVEKEVHTYTLNNVGDTVKEIHHYHNTEKVIIVDSTDRYRSVVDSLRAVIDSQKSKETVKVKERIPAWQYGVFIGIIICGCVWVLKSRMF